MKAAYSFEVLYQRGTRGASFVQGNDTPGTPMDYCGKHTMTCLVDFRVELLADDVRGHAAALHELLQDPVPEVSIHQPRAREARRERLLGQGVVERLLMMVEPVRRRRANAAPPTTSALPPPDRTDRLSHR